MKIRLLTPLLALLTSLLAFGAAGPIYRNPFTESPPTMVGIASVITNGAAVNQKLGFDGTQVVWQNDQTAAGGQTVWLNGSPVSDPNFVNDTFSVWSVTDGTNLVVNATNLTGAHLATDSVSADELNAAGVEAELEAVLDLTDLQGTLTLGKGGTGSALGAPGADRILFYDFSGGLVTFLEVGSGLQIVGTTLSATGVGVGDVLFTNFDDSTIRTNGPAGSEIYVTNITSALIVDGTLATVDYGDNSIDGTKIALGSDAQGDIMYYSGANWVRLAPGTSGQVLQTQGAASNPVWANTGAGNVLFADFNTNQFNTNNTTWDIAVKSGALVTNLIRFDLWSALGTDVDPDTSETWYKQLTGDLALTFSNFSDGQKATLFLENDSVGGHAVTWPANTIFLSPTNGPTTTAIGITTNALAVNIFDVLRRNGTNYVLGPYGRDSTNLTALAGITSSDGKALGWATNGAGALVLTNITVTGSATALDDIGDPDADTVINLSSFEITLQSANDSLGEASLTIQNTDADAANANSFIQLEHNDGADSDVIYFRALGDVDGSPTTDYYMSQTSFTVGAGIAMTINGASVKTNRTGVIRSFAIPMGAWFTNGLASVPTPASYTNSADSFGFADGVTNTIRVRFPMPVTWDAGNVKFMLASGTTATNETSATNVVWSIKGATIIKGTTGDDEVNLTFGTAVTVTNHVNKSQYISATFVTPEITVGNSPNANSDIIWEVTRLTTDSTDVNTNTVHLLSAQVFYTESATEPSMPATTN